MEKVVLITGVRRIGGHIALGLLREGWKVAALYRNPSPMVEEIKKEGGEKVLLIKRDLSEGSYEEIVGEVFSHFGRLDAFVHLASPYRRTPIGELTREEIREHFLPIAEAFVFLARSAYEVMMRNEGEVKGRIVAFGEWAVENTPYRNYVAYFVAKGALHTAVKVLAKEFAPHVLVNCIAPGPVLKVEDYSREEWERILQKTPTRRPVSLGDLVELTKFLLRTTSLTGEIVKVDGGRHLVGSGI